MYSPQTTGLSFPMRKTIATFKEGGLKAKCCRCSQTLVRLNPLTVACVPVSCLTKHIYDFWFPLNCFCTMSQSSMCGVSRAPHQCKVATRPVVHSESGPFLKILYEGGI
jgi:hypothetical protein